MLGIDHVLYINLAHRTDRLEYILNECKRVGIPSEKITRIDAIYSPDIGMLGCSLSHCRALEVALSHPEWTWTLIIEDDVKFKDSPWLETEEALRNANPDVLMLARGAATLQTPTHPSSTNLYRVISSCGAVAYVINRNYIPKLLKNKRESIEAFTKPGGNIYDHPHDVYCYPIQFTDNWYAFMESVAWQNLTITSDISSSPYLYSSV
jgi:GR25 family glycosyltransferase involved in LPS biosynthesis